MIQVRIVTVLVASAALALSGTTTSYAGPAATFKAYDRPTAKYVANSCVIDLSTLEDRTLKSKFVGCGTKVTLSSEFMKLSVPHTWLTWSCPPKVERCKPDVLSSNLITTATIDFGTTVTTGGFEYESENFQGVETVTVNFFSGAYGSGTLVGTITRDVNGDGGARLFAGTATQGFRSAIVMNKTDDDFAIAQLRV